MSFSTNKTPGAAKSGAQASVQSLFGSNPGLHPEGGLSLEEGSVPAPTPTTRDDHESRAAAFRKSAAAGTTMKHKLGSPLKGHPPGAKTMASANGHATPRPFANGVDSSRHTASARSPFSSVMTNGAASRHNKRHYSGVMLDAEGDNDIYAFRDSPPPLSPMRLSAKNGDKTRARTDKGDRRQIHAFRDLGPPSSNTTVPAKNGDKASTSGDENDGVSTLVSRDAPAPSPNMTIPVNMRADKDGGTDNFASLDPPQPQLNMRSPAKGGDKAKVRSGEDSGTPKRTPKGKSRQPLSTKKRRRADDSDSDGVVAARVEFVSGDPEAEDRLREETPSRPPVPDTRPRGGAGRARQRTVVGAREVALPRLTEKQFDSIIYGQEDAASPPPGVTVLKAVPGKGRPSGGMSFATGHQRPLGPRLHLHIDPRVHWTHDRGEEWRREKLEDISARGTRKSDFGKAAARMAAKRREARVRRAGSAGRHRNDPGEKEFGKPVDFSDVPEDELPDMVKKNEAWLRVVTFMRGCRERELAKQREAERLQKTGPSARPRRGGASVS